MNIKVYKYPTRFYENLLEKFLFIIILVNMKNIYFLLSSIINKIIGAFNIIVVFLHIFNIILMLLHIIIYLLYYKKFFKSEINANNHLDSCDNEYNLSLYKKLQNIINIKQIALILIIVVSFSISLYKKFDIMLLLYSVFFLSYIKYIRSNNKIDYKNSHNFYKLYFLNILLFVDAFSFIKYILSIFSIIKNNNFGVLLNIIVVSSLLVIDIMYYITFFKFVYKNEYKMVYN